MPIRAVLPYLRAKMKREIYITDMLLYAAWGNVKDPKSLPRYYDMIFPKQIAQRMDYTERDVIDMFRGTGNLV